MKKIINSIIFFFIDFKTIIQNIVFLLIGVLIGNLTQCSDSKPQLVEQKIIVHDTVIKNVQVRIPEKKIVYLSKTDTIFKTLKDSFYIKLVEESPDLVSTNVYIDSLVNADYKLNYEIQTVGELLSFNPQMILFRRNEITIKPKVKNWMASGAFSSNANFQVGLGYKGWFTQVEFQKKLNQVWLGKQFNF